MAQSKVTSAEVAARAGVSQSAVSRVFTSGASASSRTAEKVRKAAAELGYRPNALARAVVSGKSRIIGLVVAYLENYFYPVALEKLSEALRARGYHVLVFVASQTDGNFDTVVEEILDFQVDGIVLASVAMSSDIAERCQQAGIPVVLFNRYENHPGSVSIVTSDNVAGGRKVAEFLLAGGHERIGYIAGWDGASTQRDREAGFLSVLRAAGKSPFARAAGEFKTECARDAARAMFAPSQRPDAVFVANDHMAFAVMDVIRFELALSIPDDVSVVGYDDVPPAAWPSYDLTTVRQRANLMVEQTVTALMLDIETTETVPPRRVEIDGPLIVRGSARVPDNWLGKDWT